MTGDSLDRAATEARPPFVYPVTIGAEVDDSVDWRISDELQARLDEMNRVRDRGAAEGANYWIGG